MSTAISDRITVTRAMSLLGLLALASASLVGLVGYVNIKDAHAMNRYNEAALATGLGDMMHDAVRADVLTALLATDSAGWDAAQTDMDEHSAIYYEQLAILRDRLADKPEVNTELDVVMPEVESYLTQGQQLIAAARTGDQATVDTTLGAFQDAFSALEGGMESLNESVIDAGATAQEANTAATSAARRLVVIITVLSVAATGVLSYLISRAIRRPLHEVGSIVDSAVAGLGRATTALDRGMHDNHELVARVADEATQVEDRVNSVASGTEELSSSISEIARSTASASVTADGAVDVVAQSTDAIHALGESSEEIGAVVGIITNIAEQTNLLALNATIEAARAGSAGKGFAVVAAEVKELANQTTRATAEIDQRIQAIQGGAQGAVEAIGQVREVIEEISQTQQSISAAVEQQTLTTSTISDNIGGAAAGVTQIVQRVSDGVDPTKANVNAVCTLRWLTV
ncbi:MAG: methyl-accepting chemotaxis protein, partial [Acidimicrobiales bacterium]